MGLIMPCLDKMYDGSPNMIFATDEMLSYNMAWTVLLNIDVDR